KDGLLIKKENGKYIANINKNDIGTLRKVYNEKKSFTISGHVRDDITVVNKITKKKDENGEIKTKVKKIFVLRKNKERAAKNKWSDSLKSLEGDNVKMVGPEKFKTKYSTATKEQQEKLLQNLENYIKVMTDYINKLPVNDATKETKVAKLTDAKKQHADAKLPSTTAVDYGSQVHRNTAHGRADAQRLSAMDRDYRQSFQAAYQQKPFKADRYKLGSSDMHDWPSSAGSSVSSNRDSWYAEWNANRSY
ncbi:MAG: hypothetical protein EBU33_00425, partial [Sphingobacteriia bacterium]|nr:hypothetical protein [Sphingobacteriia bacterium]